MLSEENRLHNLLKNYSKDFYPVVKFDEANQKIIAFDFTEKNITLEKINLNNIEEFSNYISNELKNNNAKFGFGGYDELRVLYKRSELFNKNISDINNDEEPRRLHLGIDIWGDDGTEIFAPLDGSVHSFAFNDSYGDYGATIILQHQLEDFIFYTLYGHLSLQDIENIQENKKINRGELLAHFGKPAENGHWPPHLHFQVIENISTCRGDYPGVCKLSEREKYLQNCPDPDVILQLGNLVRN